MIVIYNNTKIYGITSNQRLAEHMSILYGYSWKRLGDKELNVFLKKFENK